MLALIRRYALSLVVLLSAALLVIGLWAVASSVRLSRENARLRAEAERLNAQHDVDVAALARATAAAQQLAAEYTRDTAAATRTVVRWRTVAAPQTPRETLFVAAADTAIRACTAALRTCEQRVAAAESLGSARVQLLRTDSARAVARVRLEEREAAARRQASAKRRTRTALVLGAVAGALTVRLLTP